MNQSQFVSLDRDGWRFVGIFALATLFFFTFSIFLGWIGVILTAWCVYFFRDPDRVTPEREGLIVSPADGVVCNICEATAPKELKLDSDETYTRISIFLNVFDVHVNRVPVAGLLKKSVYHAGRFFNASFDKASEHNERHTYLVKTDDGYEIPYVQIAGLIARRIRCDVSEGDYLETGSRFGMIRFGSRMDVYLPHPLVPLVVKGQRMIGGETILADIQSTETARTGVQH